MLHHMRAQQAYSQGLLRAQQEVLERRLLLRAELHGQAALQASAPLSGSAEAGQREASPLLELPQALQLRVAAHLDAQSRCCLGQCSRRTLELVCAPHAIASSPDAAAGAG